MAIALDPKRTLDYVLEQDRALPREQQTAFHLRPLTALEMRHINNQAAAYDQEAKTVRTLYGDMRYLALRAGLVGWTNFKDATGADVRFETTRCNVLGRNGDYVTDACLDCLRADWRDELAEAVMTFNTLTRDDAKN